MNEDELGVSAFLESIAPSGTRRGAVLRIGYKAKLDLVDFEFLAVSRCEWLDITEQGENLHGHQQGWCI